jgi:Nif-specific regulatory protein
MTLKLIGVHPVIRQIRRALPPLANCSAHILIIGEPGVGKTLVGRMIHSVSPQRHHQIRSLNFALLTEREQRIALLGSEPPATSTELQGCVEFNTTCLLRNIERALPHVQQSLVQALVQKEYRRTPDGPLRSVRSRIIFTVSEADFRLYGSSRLIPPFRNYLRRLPKFIIPPLRERVQDIPLIAAHYRKHGLRIPHPALSSDDSLLAPAFLKSYPWHCNVTELKACLRAAVPYSHTDLLQWKERLEFETMMMLLDEEGDFSLRRSTALIEYHILQRVLARFRNNQDSAARTLGLSPSTLRRRYRE